MKNFLRADRVGGQLQRVLSDILRKEINDPRLESALITGVKLSPDLKAARIYFTVSGGKVGKEAAAAGFEQALGYLKRTLARQLGLRYMPNLIFLYDESIDYGSHIDQLLRSLKTDDESNHTPSEE
jgi:ribosome-binding factor A